MASFNRVILVGNLTRDPELRYIPSGTAVCEVGLAVNNRRKNDKGEWVEETTFVDVTFWQRTAEVVSEYLSKGSPILVEGRLKLDTWESQDGKKQSKLRVVGETMQMLASRTGGGEGGGAPRSGGGARPARQQAPPADAPPPDDFGEPPPPSGGDSGGGDDIPF